MRRKFFGLLLLLLMALAQIHALSPPQTDEDLQGKDLATVLPEYPELEGLTDAERTQTVSLLNLIELMFINHQYEHNSWSSESIPSWATATALVSQSIAYLREGLDFGDNGWKQLNISSLSWVLKPQIRQRRLIHFI